jgi:uncharacterized protein (TIGR00369 family)
MTVPEELKTFYSQTPVNRHFHFRLVSWSSGGAVVSMELLPDYLQEEGIVQGGIIGAIADNAAVYSFLPDLGKDESITSIEFKLNFLRPATLEQGPLTASSKIIRRGRRVGVCEVEVRQSDNMIAKGTFTYLFIR